MVGEMYPFYPLMPSLTYMLVVILILSKTIPSGPKLPNALALRDIYNTLPQHQPSLTLFINCNSLPFHSHPRTDLANTILGPDLFIWNIQLLHLADLPYHALAHAAPSTVTAPAPTLRV